MPLIAYGVNHQSAPLKVRERLAAGLAESPRALRDFMQQSAVNEAVLLSTCNRTEVYTTHDDVGVVNHWLSEACGFDASELEPFSYHYRSFDAVRHVMRVASGLDSMMLGEPQILGQVKKAYLSACEIGGVGRQFKQLFPKVFSVSKQIRHETGIGQNAVSVAYAAVELAKRIFSHLRSCHVLLIGAGETVELLATHLRSQGVQQMTVANRTVERAAALADSFQARAIGIGDIPSHLHQMDIVISATASPLPILGKGAIESALKHRKRRPIFMADLAMPRDIEVEAAQLEDVYLYNIDDLQAVIDQNRKDREQAAKQAEALIDMQALHYLNQLRVLDAGTIITRFRENWETVRDQELAKALMHYRRVQDPEAAMRLLAESLTNKMLHQPTLKLRQAAYEQKKELLLLVKDLFEP